MPKIDGATNLSDMQRRYIWLAGSFHDRVLVQGRGRRSPKLLYAIHRPEELVVFGYSSPMLWLTRRGIFRPLQARNTYTLTEFGESIFARMVASGAGLKLNQQIRETEAAEPKK